MDQLNKILPENTIPTKPLSKNLKVLALAFMSLLFLCVDWILINSALQGENNLTFWIWPAIVIALSIVFITFFALTNYNKIYALALTILAFGSYVYIFPKDYLVLLGGLGFCLLMVLFEQRIRSEEKSRQNFSIRKSTAGSVSVIIYAFLFLLALNIYYNTSVDFKSNPEGFYDALGRSAARSARYISGEERSGIDFNQSVNQFLENQARENVPRYDSLPEEAQESVLEDAKMQFFRQFNLEISSEQSLADVTAQFAVDKVRAAAQNYQSFFPLIFTIVIVALLSTFSFVFRWIIILLTWLAFKLLLFVKFFRISKVNVEVDKLEI